MRIQSRNIKHKRFIATDEKSLVKSEKAAFYL